MVLGLLESFKRFLRSSTGGTRCSRMFYEGSTLRSSTDSAMCIRRLYEGSTELYGGCCVFESFFTRVSWTSFARILRSSTGGAGFSAKFYKDSTELYGWHQLSSKVLQEFYAVCVF